MTEPIRTCIGCGSKKPKVELIRIWLDGEGIIKFSKGTDKKKYAGRGSYICVSRECVERAGKKGRLSKYFGKEFELNTYTELIKIASGGE